VATRIGDPTILASSNGNKAIIAARLGQWGEALRASADAAEQALQMGILNMLPWFIELSVSTDAALLAGLGDGRLAELRARGSALEAADVVAYLRAEADRVLGGDSTS
jgi:hypothetical protein